MKRRNIPKWRQARIDRMAAERRQRILMNVGIGFAFVAASMVAIGWALAFGHHLARVAS